MLSEARVLFSSCWQVKNSLSLYVGLCVLCSLIMQQMCCDAEDEKWRRVLFVVLVRGDATHALISKEDSQESFTLNHKWISLLFFPLLFSLFPAPDLSLHPSPPSTPSLSLHLLDFASFIFSPLFTPPSLPHSFSSSLIPLPTLWLSLSALHHPVCSLSLSLSLLNHDCRPNCVMVFEGTKLQLRAVRDINAEEEVWTTRKKEKKKNTPHLHNTENNCCYWLWCVLCCLHHLLKVFYSLLLLMEGPLPKAVYWCTIWNHIIFHVLSTTAVIVWCKQ